ncbi:hypothetical protein [Nocardiopsis oceani]
MMLLALGVAVVSLCHTDAAPHEVSVAAVVTSDQNDAEVLSPAAQDEEHCDEAGLLADQRTGSLSASILLGLGVFAFAGLPVLPPRVTPVSRSARWPHRVLPLGGTRALVSLCVRRV